MSESRDDICVAVNLSRALGVLLKRLSPHDRLGVFQIVQENYCSKCGNKHPDSGECQCEIKNPVKTETCSCLGATYTPDATCAGCGKPFWVPE